MNLSEREKRLLREALSYAVMFSRSESQTAEFALLKVKLEKEASSNSQRPKSNSQ
ncbi:MAG: hypothetical protein ABJG41_01355 [Cyclobacteriaceae bacterium]